MFDKYDPGKTGRIRLNEFKRILQESNNRLSEDIPPELLDKLIHNADSYRDGYLTYNEFLQLVRTANLAIVTFFSLTQLVPLLFRCTTLSLECNDPDYIALFAMLPLLWCPSRHDNRSLADTLKSTTACHRQYLSF